MKTVAAGGRGHSSAAREECVRLGCGLLEVRLHQQLAGQCSNLQQTKKAARSALPLASRLSLSNSNTHSLSLTHTHTHSHSLSSAARRPVPQPTKRSTLGSSSRFFLSFLSLGSLSLSVLSLSLVSLSLSSAAHRPVQEPTTKKGARSAPGTRRCSLSRSLALSLPPSPVRSLSRSIARSLSFCLHQQLIGQCRNLQQE